MYGSLKNFFTALQIAPTLSGASVVFGEENIPATQYAFPLIVVVPQGGPCTPGNGYVKGATGRVWMFAETVEVMIWTKAAGIHARPIDHADAVEDAAAAVLQALEYQRPQGLNYRATGRSWATFDEGQSRLGRVLKLSFSVDVSVVNVTPPSALVTGITVNESITTSS